MTPTGLGTDSGPPRPAPGFMERHRVLTALFALLLVVALGVVIGAAVAVVLAKITTIVTHAFTAGL